MDNQSGQNTQPPRAPSISRRLQLYPFQYIGMLVIFIIPVLALLGVFGEGFDGVSASSEQVDLEVRYPTRFRYKMLNSVEVTIHNTSGQALDTITVNFERTYIDKFSTVVFVPSVKMITDSDYKVELKDIPPGAVRRITVQLQAEHYGQHQGDISIAIDEQVVADVSLATIVFP